jgi:hypothetical protein
MKKRKPSSPGPAGQKQTKGELSEVDGVMRWVERRPLQSKATGPAPGPEPAGTGGGQKGKARGRLNRAVLVMLGKGLEDCFDEVRRQEVPERFKLLLRQF